MKKAWVYLGVFVLVFGAVLVLGGKEGKQRAREQLRTWFVGEKAPARPVFIYGKTFRPDSGDAERPKMIKRAAGKITVWLPSSGDACAHESYCSFFPSSAEAPTGDVLVWWLDSWQEGEVPPFVNKHKFEVIAAVNWQALGAADAQDTYEITLTGDDGFEEFPWSMVYDTNSHSMTARIGEASIEHVTDAYDGAFCVSVQDTAWHGTAALPAYDGLRFEDIALNGDPVDADEIDEYVPAYLHPSGVDLHIIGDGNTVRFTVESAMVSGLFSWGEEWCESFGGEPDVREDYAGRFWWAQRRAGNIEVFHRDSPQRDSEQHTNAFDEHDHTAPSICPFADGIIMVATTRWGGHTELKISRDDGATWDGLGGTNMLGDDLQLSAITETVGIILMAGYDEVEEEEEQVGYAWCEISQDGGETKDPFHDGTTRKKIAKSDEEQPSIVILGTQEIVVTLTRAGVTHIYRSGDFGQTWTWIGMT